MLRQVTSLGEKQHSCTSAKRVRSLTLLKLFLPINRHTSSKALSVPFHSLHTPSIKSSTVSVFMLSLSLYVTHMEVVNRHTHTHTHTHTTLSLSLSLSYTHTHTHTPSLHPAKQQTLG